jgi:hypothetical protein
VRIGFSIAKCGEDEVEAGKSHRDYILSVTRDKRQEHHGDKDQKTVQERVEGKINFF